MIRNLSITTKLKIKNKQTNIMVRCNCKAVPSSNFGSAPQRRPSSERSALKNYTGQAGRIHFNKKLCMCEKDNDNMVELLQIFVDGSFTVLEKRGANRPIRDLEPVFGSVRYSVDPDPDPAF
jgi:hypothetical protein